ncbi:DNA ligase D [Sorangium sp. So ce1078]|uniref:DNA ligase D n=1 Tax=Sorangium sp. So ce1078 TaxID=3133329 RepID=UPI003F60CFCA
MVGQRQARSAARRTQDERPVPLTARRRRGATSADADGQRSSAAKGQADGAAATPRRTLTYADALEGARKGPFPGEVEPQLATLVTGPPPGEGWLYEVKFDGYRMLAQLRGGRVTLLTRRGQDWTERFAGVRDDLARLPAREAVLDGEIVVVGRDGVTDFQALQNALSDGNDGREGRLMYFVFDLLYLDGRDLRGCTQVTRKRALEALLAESPEEGTLRYTEHLEEDGAAVFQHACKLGIEGVIAKRPEAPYRSGRGNSWLKVKCGKRQEFVIVGFTEPTGARQGLGAILVGVNKSGKLTYAGKVGTGFTSKTLTSLRSRLESIERAKPAFPGAPRMRGVHWVEPRLIAEVHFSAWTRDGRLRHPSFEGLREDRTPESVTVEREQPPPQPPPGKAAGASSKAASAARSKGTSTAADKAVSAALSKAAGAAGKGASAATGKTASAARGKAAGAAPDMAPRRGRDGGAEKIEVAGTRLTNPDKVLYPAQGITKLALARYYAQIAEHMLPYVAERLLTLVRCPAGQGKPCFFQRHEAEGLSEAIRRTTVEEEDGKRTYLYVESTEGLVSLVQMGALEMHIWGSRVGRIEQPDMMVFDLDPAPELPWERVADAARTVRHLLETLGLRSFVKTTGGKGLHVVVPIEARRSWDEVKPFTKAVADALVRFDPARYIATLSKAKRTGKVFIDYLRNGRGATAVAPYSTRARPGAAVATPLSWDELDAPLDPAAFTIETVPQRLAAIADPWAELPTVRQSITSAMMKQVGL